MNYSHEDLNSKKEAKIYIHYTSMIVLITKSPSENGTFSVFKGQGAAFVKLRLVRVVAYLENKPKENETSLREYVKHVLTKIDKILLYMSKKHKRS